MSRELKRRLLKVENEAKRRAQRTRFFLSPIPLEWYKNQPPTAEDAEAVMSAPPMTCEEFERVYSQEGMGGQLWYARRFPDAVALPSGVQ